MSGKPDVGVGDVVATPYADQEVVEVDPRRDTIWTKDPDTGLVVEWKAEEIEDIAQPHPDEGIEALERWLRVKAVIVPSLEVEVDTTRCALSDCRCMGCYRVVKTIAARGSVPRVEITHHTDNDACSCDPLNSTGPFDVECACMKPVNIRWKK